MGCSQSQEAHSISFTDGDGTNYSFEVRKHNLEMQIDGAANVIVTHASLRCNQLRINKSRSIFGSALQQNLPGIKTLATLAKITWEEAEASGVDEGKFSDTCARPHVAAEADAEMRKGGVGLDGAAAVKYHGKPYQDTEDTYFADLLKRECMGVVKASYFTECLAKGVPFQDRNNIPKSDFHTGEEVVELWSEYGPKFLCIVSYCWLSKMHPDPHMFHLRQLVQVLKDMRYGYSSGQMGDQEWEIGVILDFCSLWQKGGAEDTRTEVQMQQFKEGLSEINTPYGNQEVTAIRLKVVPVDEKRTYDDRGWTLFESVIIDAKGKSCANGGHGVFNVLTIDKDFNEYNGFQENIWHTPNGGVVYDGKGMLRQYGCTMRQPPLTPEAFNKALNMRGERAKQRGVDLFTSGKDQPFVLDKYKKAFEELVAAEDFDFEDCGWGPDEMEILAETLKFCKALSKLILKSNRIGAAGAESLAKVLPCLTALEKLRLEENGIGDAGAESLARALPSMTALQLLNLRDNGIGDAADEQVRKAANPDCTVCI